MDQEHLQQLSEDFSLGEPLTVTRIEEGVLNHNFLLTTAEAKYFIKSIREKRKRYIPYIAAVETFMAARSIPAVQMMKNKKGSCWSQYGESLYTVYPFIESNRSHIYSVQDYQLMGEMLGKIHRAGEKDVPSDLQSIQFSEKDMNLVLAKLSGYREMLISKPKRNDTDERFLSFIDLKLSLIPTLEEVTLKNDTLVHGDYHERNLLISSEREIVGVCDWEKAQMAPRSHELVRAVHYICIQSATLSETAFENAASLLNGYRSVYSISSEEIALGIKLRFRKLATSFWIEEQYYDRKDDRSNKFIENEMFLLTNPVDFY